ncbi:MAG: RES domain-containing protein [Rhodoferax sp.]|nr:RES domain-containing protein [Rhodoferax sp.]
MRRSKPSPIAVSTGVGASAVSKYILNLSAGTRLARVYAQEPHAPARALSFNPASNGRASPVFMASGLADPAMYAAVDSQQGAVLEMLYHTVLKKFPHGAVVPASIFSHLKLVTLELTVVLRLLSVEALQSHGILQPPNFSQPRTDYGDTQAAAHALYTRYKKVAVLYASRIPPNALKKVGQPVPLMASDVADFVVEVLAYHGIVVSHANNVSTPLASTN